MNIRCQDLVAGYGRVTILPAISLEIDSGQCFALVGKNGMGKTTLLKSVLGLASRAGGRVEVLGHDVTGWQPHEIVRLGVSYAPQELSIFEDLTTDENLKAGAPRRVQYQEARDEVLEVFPRLRDRLKQKAGTLSGGERKMLLLARALLPKPQLILLDEITEGLQPSAREDLARALDDYRVNTQASILMVEQDLQFALSFAQRFGVLSNGRIVTEGEVTGVEDLEEIHRHLTL
jgi:ABC-type branched-subunit amino acid transport system ATPase component